MSQEMLISLIPIALILIIVVARAVFMKGGNGGSIAGTAVCRTCGRAFNRPYLAPNLIAGKLLRCPHCGAWAILPAASPAELEVAAMLQKSEAPAPHPVASEEDALRRRIEQSKYE